MHSDKVAKPQNVSVSGQPTQLFLEVSWGDSKAPGIKYFVRDPVVH